ncbi:alpha/beta hydrolase [Herbiconiux sp. SYSU D00978]|uniref:alpha/beta hydrolase n=1 Tax=Herbiconiux sp. SYSU D00978 TaxID=2812562 RepID=UPI001A960881|nr:alpha/beta fold hydrolase [Herbiconiux sp. SYSU D00978]
MRIDPGAVMWSAPERERAGRPLLILLHGLGSHEGDLFGLGPYLPLGPVLASVRAPIPHLGGFAWYPAGERTGEHADASAVALLDWIDTLSYTSVGVLGFSQGGAIATQLLRHRPRFFRYAVNLAGFVMPDENPGDEELARVAPPVFWGRGTIDDVIPGSLVEYTQTWLPLHTTMTERIYEGLGHGVNGAQLQDVQEFIRVVG